MVQEAAPDTAIPTEDQSGQQKAVLALATQQEAGPQTEEQKEQDQEEIAKKTFYDPSNTVYDKNFPGAWYLPGTTAAMKIGGYVNLSVVHSFDPMLIPDRFIVGSIPPDGESTTGAVDGTQVSAQQTRINWEYREQTKLGEIRAFVEGDFQGNDETFVCVTLLVSSAAFWPVKPGPRLWTSIPFPKKWMSRASTVRFFCVTLKFAGFHSLARIQTETGARRPGY